MRREITAQSLKGVERDRPSAGARAPAPSDGETRERILWERSDGLLRLGEFRADPRDPDFETFGAIGDLPAIAVARTSVGISPAGSKPFVSDSTVAVLHRPHGLYRRCVVHPAGDRCHWINAADEVLEELGVLWPRSRGDRSPRWVALPSRALILLGWAVSAARHGG
ncbi:MAG TPA: hypothetical protein VKA53_02855, partial [Thermoanaerobaculia bacterium]|nr:hypothetical protein [Thermoanaerobaculia bacterium]